MEKLDYDLIVIGNGSAGDNIARTLGRKGKRVAVIEREHLGGECLNDGCVPSKALLALAHHAGAKPSWDEVVASVHAVQLDVRGTDPNGGMRADGIDLYWGAARFREPGVVTVADKELTAPDIVIATGTAPSLPPIPGLMEIEALTNRDVFTMPVLPAKLAVIGGGPIGLELGQGLSRLGAAVTIFEGLDRVASTEDAAVSLELTRLLERGGIRILAGVKVVCAERAPDGSSQLHTSAGSFVFDKVLVAAGRSAQVPEGLRELGLAFDQRGYISIDDCGQTSLPGVWAAGDVTGKLQFTHFAGYQAHHIARHLDTGACETIPETTIPWAIFTDPEIGHVGLTEDQAREKCGDVRVSVLKASELDWFRTSGHTDGFAKVVATPDGAILGAHFICANAATIVGEATLAIAHGLSVRDVASTVHPYPTASEIFRWACAQLV